MSLKIGIVGLPNVGKSTLFNALTKTKAADAQNYPFCTIEPNVGVVEVPDSRLKQLASTVSSEKVIPTTIEFVDIAGLVKGASEGEGLGNKFLSNIRQCDAIAHVVRAFDDKDITHVHGNVDPKFDREVIESELLLADLQTVEKRHSKAQSEAKSGAKEKVQYAELVAKVFEGLNSGIMVADLDLDPEHHLQLKDLHLLTMKPYIYIVNLHEDEFGSFNHQEFAQSLSLTDHERLIPISAKIEADLAGFSEEEAREYMEALGLSESGLDALIRSAYKTLDLVTFFTSGPKETRAWTVKKDSSAPQAAGKIHTDFEKGFIKAEVVPWDSLVNHQGYQGAKEKGALRMEGKEYVVKDGDVIHFRFSN